MREKSQVIEKKSCGEKGGVAPKARDSEFSPSTSTPADRILSFQRTIGNQAVQRLFKDVRGPLCAVGGQIQAKLKIGQPGDIYEQEADRVADAVMRMPEPQVQQQPEEEEEEELLQRMLEASPRYFIQRQEEEEEKQEILQTENREDTTHEVIHDFESQIQAIRGGGQPLSESERAFFEPRFGVNFSQVKVHAGTQATESAQVLNARAYTLGQDVVFGEGQYAPETISGRRLMAHELTHVVQQNRGIETPAIQRWPWSTQRVIDAPDPTEEVPPRYVRYVIEPDDPSAQVRDLRLLAQLSELARFPHTAHVRWHSLSRGHQATVFWEMVRHYGQNFALQFWQHANAGRFDDIVTYTDVYRIEQEGIRVPLTARYHRPATEEGYQFAGAGVEVGLLYDYQLWVHPSGRRIEFHPPRASEAETEREERRSEQTEEEPSREEETQDRETWLSNWRIIWNERNQGNSVTLQDNNGETYEVARVHREPEPVDCSDYYLDVGGRTYNLYEMARNFNPNL